MKLPSALLATALALLAAAPNAVAADSSVVDLTAAAGADGNQPHEQRELWHTPYFKKECCELECKPKCGTDEVKNCEGE